MTKISLIDRDSARDLFPRMASHILHDLHQTFAGPLGQTHRVAKSPARPMTAKELVTHLCDDIWSCDAAVNALIPSSRCLSSASISQPPPCLMQQKRLNRS